MPRHVRDVTLVKGDILGIATRRGFVYTAGADGSIRRAHYMLSLSFRGIYFSHVSYVTHLFFQAAG